jgi:hypothetical protein
MRPFFCRVEYRDPSNPMLLHHNLDSERHGEQITMGTDGHDSEWCDSRERTTSAATTASKRCRGADSNKNG